MGSPWGIGVFGRGAEGPTKPSTPAEGTVEQLLKQLPSLSKSEAAELRSLRHEDDPELFWEDLLRLGSKLEARDKLDAALSIYGSVVALAPAEFKKKAQAYLDAVEGRGAVGARVEFHFRRFLNDASDPKMILPMLAGSAVYSLTKGVALGRFALAARPAWWMRGAPARLTAASLGYAVEVPAFALSSRFLHGLDSKTGQAPSLGHELASAAITLGVLKMSGGLSQAWLKPVLGQRPAPALRFAAGQVTMFGGLWSAHRLEEKLGLRSPVDGATTFTDILSSMVSLGIGASLGRKVLGEGHVARSRELELRIQSGGSNSVFLSRLLPAPKLAAAGPNVMMMSAESGEPPGGGRPSRGGRRGSSPAGREAPLQHFFDYAGTSFEMRAREGSARELEGLKEDLLDLLISGEEEGSPLQGEFVERLRAEPELRKQVLGLEKRITMEWNLAERRLLAIEVRLGDKLDFQWPEISKVSQVPNILHPPSLVKVLELYRAESGDWWALASRAEKLADTIRSNSEVVASERSYKLNELEWLLKKFAPGTTSPRIAGQALDLFDVYQGQRHRRQRYIRGINGLERSFEGRAEAFLARLKIRPVSTLDHQALADNRMAESLVKSFLEGIGEQGHPEFSSAVLKAFEERLKQEKGESFEEIRSRIWRKFKVEPEARPVQALVYSTPLSSPRQIGKMIAEFRACSGWEGIAERAETLKQSIRAGRPWSLIDKQGQWTKLQSILKTFRPETSSPRVAALALQQLTDYMGLVLSERELSRNLLELEEFGELKRSPKQAPVFETPDVPTPTDSLGSHVMVLKTFDFFADRKPAWKEVAVRFRGLHESLVGTEATQDRLIDALERVQELAEQEPRLTPPKVLRYLQAFEFAARGELAWESFEELDPLLWKGDLEALPRIKVEVPPAVDEAAPKPVSDLAPASEPVPSPRPISSRTNLSPSLAAFSRLFTIPQVVADGSRDFEVRMILPNLHRLAWTLKIGAQGGMEIVEGAAAKWISPEGGEKPLRVEKLADYKGRFHLYLDGKKLLVDLQEVQDRSGVPARLEFSPNQPSQEASLQEHFPSRPPRLFPVSVEHAETTSINTVRGTGELQLRQDLFLSNGDMIDLTALTTHRAGGKYEVKEVWLKRFGSDSEAVLPLNVTVTRGKTRHHRVLLQGGDYRLDFEVKIPIGDQRWRPQWTRLQVEAAPAPVYLRPPASIKPGDGAADSRGAGMDFSETEGSIRGLSADALFGDLKALAALGREGRSHDLALWELKDLFELTWQNETKAEDFGGRELPFLREKIGDALHEAARENPRAKKILSDLEATYGAASLVAEAPRLRIPTPPPPAAPPPALISEIRRAEIPAPPRPPSTPKPKPVKIPKPLPTTMEKTQTAIDKLSKSPLKKVQTHELAYALIPLFEALPAEEVANFAEKYATELEAAVEAKDLRRIYLASDALVAAHQKLGPEFRFKDEDRLNAARKKTASFPGVFENFLAFGIALGRRDLHKLGSDPVFKRQPEDSSALTSLRQRMAEAVKVPKKNYYRGLEVKDEIFRLSQELPLQDAAKLREEIIPVLHKVYRDILDAIKVGAEDKLADYNAEVVILFAAFLGATVERVDSKATADALQWLGVTPLVEEPGVFLFHPFPKEFSGALKIVFVPGQKARDIISAPGKRW